MEVTNPLDNNNANPQGAVESQEAPAAPAQAVITAPARAAADGGDPYASNVSGVVDDSERRVFNSS